ncbi:TPA: restriction endonuclease subunit S [Acinetobacter baumannii]
MAKYQKYAEYKDSGVEWLGEIPSHWNLYSLKRSVDKCTNGFWGNEPDGRNDLCVLRVADFNRDNFTINEDKLTLRSVLPKEAESRLLKKGDLLIEKSGGGEKTLVGCVVQFDKDFPAITSNFVAKMTPNVITDSKYLTYAFAHLYSGRVNFPSIKQTTGIQNLDSEAYLMEKFGFPSKNEQIQIANFLDHETTKIDHLIEKQQQLIELLKEKRQAVISHAVTKGLDPNVPMKDSGVEWLGEVPEHWQLVPLKYLCTFSGGGTPTKDNLSYWTDGNIPWVSPKDMKTFWISETQDYITEKAVKESSTNTVEQNSLLMVVRSGILQRTIPIAINTVPVTMNQDMKALKFGKRVLVEYIANLIHGNTVQLLLEWSKEGATVESIEHEYLANSLIPVPSLKEQEEITQVIAKKMKVYAELTEKAELQITLLQERRTALISAAVTGKIDVRNWQAPTLAGAQTELSA